MGWRRAVVRSLGISWTVVAALVVLAPPALATSCVMHPDASAASILAGEEQLALDGGFDAHYRGAVLATVDDVDTDAREGSASHGRTVVRLTALGTHGDVTAGQVRIEMADPGWMLGYGFEVGATYFVPVRHEPTDVMACEPITRVADDEVDGLVGQLEGPADEVVLTVGATTITAEPASAAAETGSGRGVPAWIWVGVASVLIVGAIVVTALIGRDRR